MWLMRLLFWCIETAIMIIMNCDISRLPCSFWGGGVTGEPKKHSNSIINVLWAQNFFQSQGSKFLVAPLISE